MTSSIKHKVINKHTTINLPQVINKHTTINIHIVKTGAPHGSHLPPRQALDGRDKVIAAML